jgi:glycosyltransferase involved in cell wall biosynthesis
MKILLCTNTMQNLRTLRLSFVSALSREVKELRLLTIDTSSDFAFKKIFDDDLIRRKNYVKFSINIFRFLSNKSSKAVLTFTTEAIFITCFMGLFFQFKHICIFTGLGSLFNSKSLKNSIILFFAAPLVRKSHLIIVQNKQDAIYLAESWKIDFNKIKVVNGSGINTDQPLNCEKSHTSQPKCFLLIARLIKEKGILDFLKAVEILRRDDEFNLQSVSFTIFGNYDNNNPSNLKEYNLEEKCKVLDIKLLEYSSSSLQSVLKKHSHFVLPSYREGTSKALLEACLSNLFPIVANVPGCNNVVKNGISGLLFQPRNPQDQSRAILEACQLNSNITQEISNKARSNVLKNFSEKTINKKMLELITTELNT